MNELEKKEVCPMAYLSWHTEGVTCGDCPGADDRPPAWSEW